MTIFSAHPVGSPCWVDLASPGVDASVAFYTAVFGWEATEQHDPDGNRIYVMFTQDGKNVAGLGGQAPGMEGMPPIWNTYVAVADVDATMATITANGGTEVQAPFDIPGVGRMGAAHDPAGGSFSLMQPAPQD